MATYRDVAHTYTTPVIENVEIGRAIENQNAKQYTITYIQNYADYAGPAGLNSTDTRAPSAYLVEETQPLRIGFGLVRFARVYVELPGSIVTKYSGFETDYGQSGFRNTFSSSGAGVYAASITWSEYGARAPKPRPVEVTRTRTFSLSAPSLPSLAVPPTIGGSTVDWTGTKYAIDNSTGITPEQIAEGKNRWVSDGSTSGPTSGVRSAISGIWRGAIYFMEVES
jgi:hypothetical protein